MEHPDHWEGAGSPAAQGRRAQLLLALMLLSLLPAFLLSVPIPTHAVRLDLPPLPETIVPLRPYEPQALVLTTLLVRDPKSVPARPVHELVLKPGDLMFLDGQRVDVQGLWERLEVIAARDDEWVDLRPDPHARYELFAEVLAITRRTYVERLRLDSRPFRGAIDEE